MASRDRPGTLHWPLVARDDEQEALMSAYESEGLDAVVLAGPAGVGKSRLVDETTARLSRTGVTTHRLVATASLQAVPFGAIAPMLPADVAALASQLSTAAAVSAAMRDAIRSADGRRSVVFVDDIQLLDESSASVIAQMIVGRWAFVMATLRIGESVPESLRAAVQSDRMAWLDLQPLDRDQSKAVLEAVLDGQVEGSTEISLWDVCQGNPLYLREMVIGAIGADRLVVRDGVWSLVGPMLGSSRLTELLSNRMRSLTDQQRELLDFLALCEPVPLDRLTAAGYDHALEEMVESGRATISDGGRWLVRLSHPLHTEVLRQSMSPLTRLRLLGDHVRRLEAATDLTLDEEVHLGMWRLDLGLEADIRSLMRAARIARNAPDFVLTRRLSQAAVEGGAGVEAVLLLGDSLYEVGEHEAARRVMSDALDASVDEMQRTFLAMNLHLVDLWGLDAPADALRRLREVRAGVTVELFADALRAGEMNVVAFSEQPLEALRLDAEIQDDSDLVEFIASVPRCTALIIVGRIDESLVAIDHAMRTLEEQPDPLGIIHPAIHLITKALALVENGAIDEGAAVAEEAYDQMVRIRMSLNEVWSAATLGRAHLFAGRMRSAQRWANNTRAAAQRCNLRSGIRLATVIHAIASAQLGHDDIDKALEHLRSLPTGAGFFAHETAVAEAACLVQLGRFDEARSVLHGALASATGRGLTITEAFLVHELTRLGEAAEVTHVARDLLARTESPFVHARMQHTLAASQGDVDSMAAAAEALAALGANLFAAEACYSAADLARADGDQRAAARHVTRAEQLRSFCEGAETPGLLQAKAVVPLSAREREIAMLAADGMTSRVIAERLVVSSRTVENHLQRVFSKLGVTSRAELIEALGRC